MKLRLLIGLALLLVAAITAERLPRIRGRAQQPDAPALDRPGDVAAPIPNTTGPLRVRVLNADGVAVEHFMKFVHSMSGSSRCQIDTNLAQRRPSTPLYEARVPGTYRLKIRRIPNPTLTIRFELPAGLSAADVTAGVHVERTAGKPANNACTNEQADSEQRHSQDRRPVRRA